MNGTNAQIDRLTAEVARLSGLLRETEDRLTAALAERDAQIAAVRSLHTAAYVNDEVTPRPVCRGCAQFHEHIDCPTLAALDGTVIPVISVDQP